MRNLLLLLLLPVFFSCGDKENDPAIDIPDPDFTKVGELLYIYDIHNLIYVYPTQANQVIDSVLNNNQKVRWPVGNEINELYNKLSISYDEKNKLYWVGKDCKKMIDSRNSFYLKAEYDDEKKDYRARMFKYYTSNSERFYLDYGEYYTTPEGAKRTGVGINYPFDKLQPPRIKMALIFVKK